MQHFQDAAPQWRQAPQHRKIAETIAQALNVPVLELHSTSNLTQEDFDNGETYISLMERNLKVLEKLFIIEENE